MGYHGLLSLQNVLIDSNWVLKLTNFGIINLLNKALEREQLKLVEIIPMSSKFMGWAQRRQGVARRDIAPIPTYPSIQPT